MANGPQNYNPLWNGGNSKIFTTAAGILLAGAVTGSILTYSKVAELVVRVDQLVVNTSAVRNRLKRLEDRVRELELKEARGERDDQVGAR